MEGWVGLVGWPIVDALPTKWSHVNHGSGVDQGKSNSYRLTSQPLSHAANHAAIRHYTARIKTKKSKHKTDNMLTNRRQTVWCRCDARSRGNRCGSMECVCLQWRDAHRSDRGSQARCRTPWSNHLPSGPSSPRSAQTHAEKWRRRTERKLMSPCCTDTTSECF